MRELGAGRRAAHGFQQLQRDQLALYDQPGKLFDVLGIGGVIMNPVTVEGHRRESKQGQRIGHYGALPRRARSALARAGGFLRGALHHVHVDDVLFLDHGQPGGPEEAVAQGCNGEMRGGGRAHLGFGEFAFASHRLADHEPAVKLEARAAEQAPLHGNGRNEIVLPWQTVVAELRPGWRLQAEDRMPARRQSFADARRRQVAVERDGKSFDQRRGDVILGHLAPADRPAQAGFQGLEIHGVPRSARPS